MTDPTSITVNGVDVAGTQHLRDAYSVRPRGAGYRYELTNITQGQADVYDDRQLAYRGTVTRCLGGGLSGHCEGKWMIFHTQLNRYITPDDVTNPAVRGLAEFAEQELHGGYYLVFRTRHDAALCALLSF